MVYDLKTLICGLLLITASSHGSTSAPPQSEFSRWADGTWNHPPLGTEAWVQRAGLLLPTSPQTSLTFSVPESDNDWYLKLRGSFSDAEPGARILIDTLPIALASRNFEALMPSGTALLAPLPFTGEPSVATIEIIRRRKTLLVLGNNRVALEIPYDGTIQSVALITGNAIHSLSEVEWRVLPRRTPSPSSPVLSPHALSPPALLPPALLPPALLPPAQHTATVLPKEAPVAQIAPPTPLVQRPPPQNPILQPTPTPEPAISTEPAATSEPIANNPLSAAPPPMLTSPTNEVTTILAKPSPPPHPPNLSPPAIPPSPTDQSIPAPLPKSVASEKPLDTPTAATIGPTLDAVIETMARLEPPRPPEPARDPMDHVRLFLQKKEPLVWLFLGDSITHGAVWTSGARSYPEHFNEFVRWESGRFEDVVINNATNGSTAESVLETLEAKALRFHPHVVFIMLGINDAEHATRRGEGTALFENNLRSIVIALKENGVLPILQTPNFPALPEKSPRLATTRAMVAAIRKVSKEEHIPLVDHWHRWEAARNDTRRVYRWLGDQVHPNAEGHRHMMQTIRTAIYPPEVTP